MSTMTGPGLRIDVRSNLREVEISLGRLAENLRDKALVRALNRTATTIRAEAAREIKAEYNMTIGDIKGQMRIENATAAQLRSRVVVSGKPISLSGFGPRQNAQGVTVMVKRGQRKLIRHAFLLNRPGGSAVFERVGNARLPIKKLFTLSLPSAFTNDKVMAALKRVAATRFPEAFAQESRYYLSKVV